MTAGMHYPAEMAVSWGPHVQEAVCANNDLESTAKDLEELGPQFWLTDTLH